MMTSSAHITYVHTCFTLCLQQPSFISKCFSDGPKQLLFLRRVSLSQPCLPIQGSIVGAEADLLRVLDVEAGRAGVDFIKPFRPKFMKKLKKVDCNNVNITFY
jgi:hypothetical protein